MKRFTAHTPRSRGFSLVEVLTVIGLIGIAAAAVVASISDVSEAARKTVATDITEKLNQSVRQFSQVNWDLRYSPVAASASDEMLVLRSLQYRDPNDPAHGSPYFRNNWSPSTSSDSEDYRIQWTGSAWRLLTPGATGTGLKVVFDGSDLGTAFVFPATFAPVGS